MKEEEALPPPDRLLSFYDRLRGRVLSGASRGGSGAEKATELLLAAPDLFLLLVRLAIDPEVPSGSRRLIGGALLYFIAPFDFFPEGVLGVGGFVDDVVLAAAVLAHALGELEGRAERHWSGRKELRQVLRDVSRAAETLLGRGLLSRLQSMLERRGVEPVWSKDTRR